MTVGQQLLEELVVGLVEPSRVNSRSWFEPSPASRVPFEGEVWLAGQKKMQSV